MATSNRYYLRFDSDYLIDAKPYKSKAAAISAFKETALELRRYGQVCTASIHVAVCREALDEYPDYVLSLGPRYGVVVERA